MNRFSVLTPHYNDAARLNRLLSSLPKRDDLQVIIVDDCSPDQSGLAELKNNYPHVMFLSTPTNQGAGAARNIGLKHVTGEFVLFADADDEFLPNAFDHFDQAITKNADICYFLADAVIESTGESSSRADSLNSLVEKYCENPNKENECNLRLSHCVPWAKLYKKSFIDKHKINFDEIPVSNDIYFNIINGVLATDVYVSKKPVYRCYRLTDSLTSTLTADRLICRTKASAKVANTLKKMGVRHDRSASGFIVQSLSFGLPTFLKVSLIAMKSDLNLNLTRVFNFSRWLTFAKRRKNFNKEVNK